MKADTVTQRRPGATSLYELHSVPSPDEWSAALRRFAEPHALQSWAWGALKTRWGWNAMHFLIGPSAGKEESVAAAMVLKRRLPRTPFSILYVPRGPIFDYSDPGLRAVVFEKLVALAKQEKAIFVKVDPEVVRAWDIDPEQPSPVGIALISELRERGWRFSNDQIQFRNTVLLDLTPDEEELLASMKQKTRYNIRLAGRRDVHVRRGDAADLALIGDMYRETANRDGFAIRPLEYYLDAWRTLYDAGLAQPFIAEFEREPLGAVIIVRSGNRAIYMYGASTEKERNRMPNYLLQWEAIRWAKQAGCTTYDFWGAPDEFVESDRMWGVWRFKSGFNGQVVKHVGAWDYPSRPLFYWLYTVLIPRYLAFLRRRQSD